MVHGTNVIFHYFNKIIHFCFLSGIARTANVQGHILTTYFHASDSQISVICLQRKDGSDVPEGERRGYQWKEYQFQVKRILLQDNELQCSSLPHHDLSSLIQEDCEVSLDGELPSYDGCQISCMLHISQPVPEGSPKTRGTIYFSFEADDTVAVHSMPWYNDGDEFPPSCHVDQDLMYTCNQCDEVGIVFGRPMLSSAPPGAMMYHLELDDSTRKVPLTGMANKTELVYVIRGDDEFVIFVTGNETMIWSFDESWKPPGIFIPVPET